MIAYEASRSARGGRWQIWAALVLGLLFLGLGAPLMAQNDGGAQSVSAESRLNLQPRG